MVIFKLTTIPTKLGVRQVLECMVYWSAARTASTYQLNAILIAIINVKNIIAMTDNYKVAVESR